MTDQHPITPPSELIGDWITEAADLHLPVPYEYIANCAARWGADQELEACCKCLTLLGCSGTAAEVRADRRPKPPSLRKQAYDALDTYIYGEPDPKDKETSYNTIRRALEALPND